MFLPGESQGQGNLVGYRLWGRKESDMTKATYPGAQIHVYRVGDAVQPSHPLSWSALEMNPMPGHLFDRDPKSSAADTEGDRVSTYLVVKKAH